MDQYFIGRNCMKLKEFIKQETKDKVEFAFFVDEKVDSTPGLDHLIINNSTFSNIGFKQAEMRQCDFSFCVFINCYFKWANLQQVKFQSCEFINCNFEHTSFSGCDFQYAEFVDCYIPYAEIKANLPHERENINRSLCRTLSIQCLKLGAVEDYKQYLFEERNAGEIHAIRKLFHSGNSYYNKYSFLDGLEGLAYFLRSKLSKFLWGYGERMGVLLRNIVLVILVYAASYLPIADKLLSPAVFNNKWFDALYFSACMFFSANIAFAQQSVWWQVLMLSEHVVGAVLVGFFGAALFRQINRR